MTSCNSAFELQIDLKMWFHALQNQSCRPEFVSDKSISVFWNYFHFPYLCETNWIGCIESEMRWRYRFELPLIWFY